MLINTWNKRVQGNKKKLSHVCILEKTLTINNQKNSPVEAGINSNFIKVIKNNKPKLIKKTQQINNPNFLVNELFQKKVKILIHLLLIKIKIKTQKLEVNLGFFILKRTKKNRHTTIQNKKSATHAIICHEFKIVICKGW